MGQEVDGVVSRIDLSQMIGQFGHAVRVAIDDQPVQRSASQLLCLQVIEQSIEIRQAAIEDPPATGAMAAPLTAISHRSLLK
ncbi:MAG: hypothetical protein R3E68_01730 [Burkholderiaceae bacterium]